MAEGIRFYIHAAAVMSSFIGFYLLTVNLIRYIFEICTSVSLHQKINFFLLPLYKMCGVVERCHKLFIVDTVHTHSLCILINWDHLRGFLKLFSVYGYHTVAPYFSSCAFRYSVMFTVFPILINLICSICCQTFRLTAATPTHFVKQIHRSRRRIKCILQTLHALTSCLWAFFTYRRRYDGIDNPDNSVDKHLTNVRR